MFKTHGIELSQEAKVTKGSETCAWLITDEAKERNYQVRLAERNLSVQSLDSEGKLITPASTQKLDPNPYAVDSIIDSLYEKLASLADGQGVVVVGHQPQLGWIARRLLGKPVPIANAEVICIVLRRLKRRKWYLKSVKLEKVGRLLWSISNEAAETMQQLREKINSKMETAKLLGGFIVVVLSFLLGFLLDPGKLSALDPLQKLCLDIAAVLFLAAIILYWATMFAYDTLLMPTRFWGEVPRSKPALSWLPDLSFLRWLKWEPMWRPPSSSHLVIYQAMRRIWSFRFIAATTAVIVGLGCLTVAVLNPLSPIQLFDMSAEYREALNAITTTNSPFSTADMDKTRSLQFVFAQNGHVLSGDALALIESTDRKWFIVANDEQDSGVMYIIQREGVKLRVYRPFAQSSWTAVLNARGDFLVLCIVLFIVCLWIYRSSEPKLGVGD